MKYIDLFDKTVISCNVFVVGIECNLMSIIM